MGQGLLGADAALVRLWRPPAPCPAWDVAHMPACLPAWVASPLLVPRILQALCMVHSWPFFPDAKRLEAAVKEKAG